MHIPLYNDKINRLLQPRTRSRIYGAYSENQGIADRKKRIIGLFGKKAVYDYPTEAAAVNTGNLLIFLP